MGGLNGITYTSSDLEESIQRLQVLMSSFLQMAVQVYPDIADLAADVAACRVVDFIKYNSVETAY